MIIKQCKNCNSDFEFKYRTRRNHCSTECYFEYQKKIRPPTDNTSDASRNSKYKWRYGITLEEYNVMLASQDNCCKVCNIHEDKLSKKLCVDHDHKTGEVRGLLCADCNIGLGNLKDDPEIIENLLTYIKEYK